MKFRFKAFGLHLLGSATVLLLINGGLYFGWYRWPAWYLADVMRVILMMAGVDLALGPLLTFTIASPSKPRRELARDIGIIVAVQLLALAFATVTLWRGRPLYYTFSADRLEVVRALEIEPDEADYAIAHNPQLAPHWYSRPRWVWAEMPGDPKLANDIVQSVIGGGSDVVDMPRYFRSWEQGLPELRKQLKPASQLRELSKQQQQQVAAQTRALGLPADQPNAMFMAGRTDNLVALFDLRTLKVRALVKTH
jgi:hypothetical protein